ncbi:hypothetical protein LTR56_004718 [Elasticomyces elasticus]|nr:hypothetical protein LTR56_004718 [Elasticomyces elasticus]KAK3665573.1 hypothetical protein LTR22_003513 [Elasticomyces elasticus]KAK4930389.1 hypothetical protein LTR49_003130 [Elasticomyces elasticus]KAK5768884.1 hypothetical protein LTS12_000944 [Elasticomyces elasticus]
MATTDPRESLCVRINAAVEPWRNSHDGDIPPFNGKQLVVMALIMSGKPINSGAVCTWILNTFSYYRSMATEAFWAFSSNDGGGPSMAYRFHEMLDEAFETYELPLLVSEAGAGTKKDDILYTITPLMGEPWLALPRDGPSDDSIFPFFELPPELRNSIYTMVFQYPSKIYIAEWGTPYVRTRDLDRISKYRVNILSQPEFVVKKFGDVLSPLLVNRRFHDEAMPVFFDINTFYFASQPQMSKMIMALSDSRLKYVRSIGFEYKHKAADSYGDERHFEALTALPNLRKLALYFNRSDWDEKLSLRTERISERSRAVKVLRAARERDMPTESYRTGKLLKSLSGEREVDRVQDEQRRWSGMAI